MEVLSPTEIILLAGKENDSLHLPSKQKTCIIPFKEEIQQPLNGAVFQKTCSSCQSPSKYQCPKCSALSCSLDCVKSHKLENNCDGIREKTAFVAVEDFKDVNLHSDFHFLEDAQRQLDIARRGKRGQGLMHGCLPHNLYRLQVAAKLRKTDLQILPLLFSKRKRSTTYLRYSDRKIFWRLEWEFPHSEFSCFDERVDEDTILEECMNKHIKSDSSTDIEGKLSYYHNLQPQDITVLLLDEDCPANITRYHILEKKKSLKSNFRHKKIIEYPSLLVISAVHLSSYQIAE